MSDRKAKGKHKKDHEKGAYLKITETVEKNSLCTILFLLSIIQKALCAVCQIRFRLNK